MVKKYYGLDIGKFICAVLIIASHYASEWGNFSKSIDMIFSLYIVSVPFFFAVSGFLLFSKLEKSDNTEQKNIMLLYIKKILIMYLVWSIIYVTFNVITFCYFGVSNEELMSYIHQCIVYSTYDTIWFLPALGIGVIMVYFMRKIMPYRYLVIVAVIFYIIGMLGVSYRGLIEESNILKFIYEVYDSIFFTTRNGVFNGFPFVAIGAYIAYEVKKKPIENQIKKYFLLSAFFCLLFVFEAFFIKKVFLAPNANTLFMLFPFTYFIIKFLLCIKITENKICYVMRKLSTTMFLSQRIFLTALPVLFTNSFFEKILIGNSYVGLLYIIGITVGFSILLTILGKYIKFFRLMT